MHQTTKSSDRKTNLITDLTKYTDFNKARAFEGLVDSLQMLLSDYQESDSEVAEVVALVSSRLLSRAWDLLLDLGEEQINE